MDQNFEALLRDDPGNPAFANFAESLLNQGKWSEALEVCLAGLSSNPSCHKGRLLLARVYFERNHLPFAVREVRELLDALPENKFIRRLLERLSPESAASSGHRTTGNTGEEKTVAEAEFDIGEIDLLVEDKKN